MPDTPLHTHDTVSCCQPPAPAEGTSQRKGLVVEVGIPGAPQAQGRSPLRGAGSGLMSRAVVRPATGLQRSCPLQQPHVLPLDSAPAEHPLPVGWIVTGRRA